MKSELSVGTYLEAISCNTSPEFEIGGFRTKKQVCNFYANYYAVGSVSRTDPFPIFVFLSVDSSGLLLAVRRVHHGSFVLFLEAVGLRESCIMAVESRPQGLCFVRSPKAARAPRAPNRRPTGLVA